MKPGAPKGQKIFKNKIKKTQNGRSVSDYCCHNMEPGARVWRPGATTYGCMHLLHTFID